MKRKSVDDVVENDLCMKLFYSAEMIPLTSFAYSRTVQLIRFPVFFGVVGFIAVMRGRRTATEIERDRKRLRKIFVLLLPDSSQ